MRVVLKRAVPLAFLIALALPVSASAFTVIPPTNSGADQYVESVPTAGGNRSSHPVGGGGAAARTSGSIAPSTQAALIHQGVVGRRTAELARRFAPAKVRHKSRGHSSGGASAGAGSDGGASGSGSSPLGTLVRALVGAPGHGAPGSVVPIALILATLGVGAVALRHRRAG
jgi:hypothetical protein